MLTDYIIPGNRIELKSNADTWLQRNEENRSYVSEVYDIVSEDRIDVMMPMEQGKLILLPVNGEYNVAFYSQKGLYQCNARVADRYRTNNMYILSMDLTSSLQKLQRREYYRLSCAVEMKSRLLSEYENMALKSNPAFVPNPAEEMRKAIIVNISGGGVRFVSTDHYEAEDRIYVSFPLRLAGGDHEFRVTGKVLKVEPLENRDGLFEHRVQFLKISDSEREDIIHYIFEEERKIRKKQD